LSFGERDDGEAADSNERGILEELIGFDFAQSYGLGDWFS
jgi:hypothetical protein